MSLNRKTVIIPELNPQADQATVGLNLDEYLYVQKNTYLQASEAHDEQPMYVFSMLIYPNEGATYTSNFPLDRESVALIIDSLEEYLQRLPPLPKK